MRIDLTTTLYGKLAGRPKATPRDVLNKRLQKVADAYAVTHKKAFGEVWGPYRERSQS